MNKLDEDRFRASLHRRIALCQKRRDECMAIGKEVWASQYVGQITGYMSLLASLRTYRIAPQPSLPPEPCEV